MERDVLALAVYNNRLIAGGQFTTAGGITAKHIAQWDGNTWQPLGMGLGSPAPFSTAAYALTVYNGQLIVGGYFTQAGGAPANYIAAWNGSGWSQLGDGLNERVYALTVQAGKLIAAGFFSYAGGAPASKIASWNGSTWSSIGNDGYGPLTGAVRAVCTYNGMLIAGGEFGFNNRLAAWNGTNWQSVGGGTDGPVWSLAPYGNNLIVGGSFNRAGGVYSPRIVQWTGTMWQPLGSGVNATVKGLEAVSDGTLVAIGDFLYAGGASANRIAQWDGTSWHSLGSGLSPGVGWAVTDFQGSIVAGGGFTSAGEITANKVANWTCAVPVDSDGDGLFDDWESQNGGIDVNSDGVIDLDLYALGARPDQRDVFVEIDSMTGYGPLPGALEPVREAFASKGISLWMQIEGDQDIEPADWFDIWPSFDAIKASKWGTTDQRMSDNSANVLAAKRLAYRYCVFARRFRAPTGDWGSGGKAEIGGNDFVVTLGDASWTNDFSSIELPTIQAALFMHELGHTLGLRHGGGQDDPYDWRYNCKPNYCSVMNALWHTPLPSRYISGQPLLESFRASWRLDYSDTNLPELLENSLDEGEGIGTDSTRYVAIGPANLVPGAENIVRMGTPVDFDGDGSDFEIGVSRDLNGFNPEAQPRLDVLNGFNDWQNLSLSFISSAEAADGVHLSDDAVGEPSQFVRRLIVGKTYGDMNCSGMVDGDDIKPFLLAMTNPTGYTAAYPHCNMYFGDFDHDGTVGISDIPLFVNRLLSE